jgi:protein TonB
MLGDVITRVQPLYPVSAKKVNATGKVEVQVTVSVKGHVIEAKAISGHQLLRQAAVDAAIGWVFKPTILDGVPVQVQSILTFVFTPP